MADDLGTPLQAKQKAPSRLRLPVRPLTLFAAAMAAVLAGVVVWILVFDDPLGGEPRQIVKIENFAPKQAPDGQTKAPPTQPAPDSRTVTIIDGNTGVKRDVVINAPPPNNAPANTPATPANVPAAAGPQADLRLIEPSKHGSIPKIGADGTRALEVYASPIPVAAGGNGNSMIAIVVTGLGVSASGTAEAIAKLPAAITLGFIPYASELPGWVARARSTGHEVILQVPMEPFDYPDNDPGPQTLTASAPKAQNIDRLHFFMSRTQGYVGMSNFMGARFTANEDALAAVIAETGKRGLLFFDDGTSPRSVSAQAAAKTKAPFLKSDLVLDAKAEWAEIDAALARLETLAAEKGIAIATAGALPVTVERIARWAKTLEARGIRLVPVSVAYQRKAKQS